MSHGLSIIARKKGKEGWENKSSLGQSLKIEIHGKKSRKTPTDCISSCGL
jgi:hypothetical protein